MKLRPMVVRLRRQCAYRRRQSAPTGGIKGRIPVQYGGWWIPPAPRRRRRRTRGRRRR